MAKKQSYLKKKKSFSGAQVLLFTLVFAAVGAVAVWQSLAAPHNGGGGGGGSKTTYTGSFSMVMVNDANGDGLPNYNDQITFKVSSNAAQPLVTLSCYQGTTQVDNQTVGFYAGWPWSQTYTLSHWYYWPNDSAADCKATLYYQGTRGNVTLSTMSFHVNP